MLAVVQAVDVTMVTGFVVAILMLSVVLLALIAYLVRLQISRDKKDDLLESKNTKIDELSIQIAEMTEEGTELSQKANVLNQYYEYTNDSIKQLISRYIVYKNTGIDNILKHRYFGDDPVIQHFIKETLEFDKDFTTYIETYNKTVGDIFDNN